MDRKISFARLWEDGTWDTEDVDIPDSCFHSECWDCDAVEWYRDNLLSRPGLRDVVTVTVLGWE